MSKTIEIVWGTYQGKTNLGSFDGALEEAGIHNYNLSKLSSVIPPESKLKQVGYHKRKWEIGSTIACVLSLKTSDKKGNRACSGIGWSISDRGGIFYEAFGSKEKEVENRIKSGLLECKNNRDSWEWNGKDNMKIVSINPREDRFGASAVVSVHGKLEVNYMTQ